MNCPQCQTANGPDAGFCGSCGARLAPAQASAAQGYNAPGYNAPGNYQAGNYGAGNQGPQQGFGGAPGPNQNPMGHYTPGSVGALSNFKFDLSRLTTVDRVVGIATFVAMISIWLDWYTGTVTMMGQTSSGSISGTGYHGWLWLEFFVALALLVYLVARAGFDRLPFNLPVGHETLLIAGTGLQLLLVLIAFFVTPPTPATSDLVTGETASVSWAFGAFLGLLAALVAAGPVIYPAVRSYLDSRKAGTTQGY